VVPSISTIRNFLHGYRSLLSLGVAALLAELAYAILNLSAMPVYVKYTLKAEPALGIIISTFLLTEAVSRPAFGALGDKIGRKPLLIAGPAVTALTAYLTVRLQGPHVVLGLIGLRAIDGFGSGALWPTAFAAVGDLVEEKNRSAAMSMLNVTYMSGLALGFLLGGAVNRAFHSYSASFYLVSALLVACVIVMAIFLPNKIGAHHHSEPLRREPLEVPTLEEPTEFKLSSLTRSFRQVPEMLVLACVVFLGIGLLMPVVKLYAIDHLGLNEVQFGIAVAPIAAFMGIFAVPLGQMGDRYGKCTAVCWGILGSAIAMWVLALFRSIWLAGAAGVVLGLGFTVAFPAWMALVSSATDTSRRGEVLGAVGMAQGLAAIIGASAGGFIYSSDLFSFPRLGVVNYNVPFWFAAVLLTAGAVVGFTWVSVKHCGSREPGLSRTHSSVVVVASLLGLLVLCVWIGVRYARPIPPDRVAWEWMQQLVRGRPDRALKFTAASDRADWNPASETEAASRRFCHWREKRDAVYTVRFTESETPTRAVVPVEFRFAGNRRVTEYVVLCREQSSEWKVCGLREERP